MVLSKNSFQFLRAEPVSFFAFHLLQNFEKALNRDSKATNDPPSVPTLSKLRPNIGLRLAILIFLFQYFFVFS